MHRNAELIRRFHEAQNRFYAGGPAGPLAEMLSEDVVWHVPGRSPIAGEHRGRDAVLDYFTRRRDLARATFRVNVRRVLADDEGVIQLAGGRVELDGRTWHWETVGVFRVDRGRIAECRLLPFDLDAFDDVWLVAAGRRPPAAPDDAEVRSAGRDDLGAVLSLWRECGVLREGLDTRRELERLLDADPGSLLVAQSGERVIGTLIAAWDGWRANLYRLAVSPHRRRRGVARELIAEAERRLLGRGARRFSALIEPDDEVARAVWTAAGYVPDRADRLIKTR